jgi:FkbM family methyltransferase
VFLHLSQARETSLACSNVPQHQVMSSCCPSGCPIPIDNYRSRRRAGTTSHIVSNHPGSNSRFCSERKEILVKVMAGDQVIADGEAALPNIIKIDVEGHELEVVHGLPSSLQNPRLRAAFIEIHFALLRQRGLARAPREIEQFLMARGLQISWVDLSHLQAIRVC